MRVFVRSRVARLLALVVCLGAFGPAGAQPQVDTPNFTDQRQLPARSVSPDLARIRFLTSVDFPPFNFLDARGRLAGFHVELARAICEELDVIDICQIEARPFDELLPALMRGEGEAIIAGLAVTPENRDTLAFTQSYFRFPARFVTRAGTDLSEPLAQGLPGQRVGVVEGAAHQAMLGSFFPAAEPVLFPNRDAMLEALRSEDVDVVFGDGVNLSFWLAGDTSEGCCTFAGGPYLSERFLGEGLAIALAPSNAALAEAFDDAILRIVASGRFSELLLRAFPISAF